MANGADSPVRDQTIWKAATLFLLTAAILLLCGMMVRPFLAAITGAVVLALVTRIPQRWLKRKTGNATLAATLGLLLVTISIIAPAGFLVRTLARQALAGAEMLQNGSAERNFNALMDRYPQIGRAVQQSSEFITLGEAAEKSAGFVATHLVGVLGNSLAALTQIVIMLFLLFFLYRDEEAALRLVHRLLPLRPDEAGMLLRGLEDTIRATVLGRLAIAGLQGLAAGCLFAALGIHTATLLGILTTVSAIVPTFGAYAIWLPVAGYLALTGHWVKMAILVAFGSLVISTMDNFLYPVLVGARLRQHTSMIFLALLGGIWFFGVPGLILGPVLFSAAESLLSIWDRRLQDKSLAANP